MSSLSHKANKFNKIPIVLNSICVGIHTISQFWNICGKKVKNIQDSQKEEEQGGGLFLSTIRPLKLKLWYERKNRQLDKDHQLKAFQLPLISSLRLCPLCFLLQETSLNGQYKYGSFSFWILCISVNVEPTVEIQKRSEYLCLCPSWRISLSRSCHFSKDCSIFQVGSLYMIISFTISTICPTSQILSGPRDSKSSIGLWLMRLECRRFLLSYRGRNWEIQGSGSVDIELVSVIWSYAYNHSLGIPEDTPFNHGIKKLTVE